MSHYVANFTERKSRRFTIPKINGRVGVSFYIGMKEIFLGIVLTDVILEQIIKKRFVKIPKADTRTYGFDPFSSDR